MIDNTLISIEKLSKSYQEVVVDHVSFSVKKGEVFGLLGPNGAGKTTIIKMLCGLLKPDSGEIIFNGLKISKNYRYIKTRIGLCPQEIVIWKLLTPLEQLKFLGIAYDLSPKIALQRAEELLHKLKLWDKRHSLSKTLSGGMQRRLNIALALIHDPELIILDEPQAGLDPQNRILVRDFIRELAKEKTVLLTTHDMDEADRMSDRIGIIDHGKILLIDTPEKIKANSGMGDILQIRVNGIDTVLAHKIMNAFPPELNEKKYLDELILLSGEDLLEVIPVINNIFKKFDVKINDMVIRKRTLEDAFIILTGRGLQE